MLQRQHFGDWVSLVRWLINWPRNNCTLIIFNSWAQIELETQANYPDKIQAISAGILEGALTWKNIYEQWSK